MKVTIELNTDYKEDYNALLALLGVGRREVKAATAEEPESEKQKDEEPQEVELPVETEPEAPYSCDTAMPMDEQAEVEPEAPQEEVPNTEQEDAPKSLTLDQWDAMLLAKRKELGLLDKNGNSVGASMAELRSQFNDFVKEHSLKYGAPTPRKLSPEKLYDFVQEVFSRITLDPACGFKIGEYPQEVPF